MIGATLGWRLLRRDLAAGEVRVLLAALVLAVCAVASVGFLTDRAQRALDLEANRLLGGDAVLRSDRPIDDALRERAAELGLQRAETISFPSMLRVADATRLGDIRALGPRYPLRGTFQLQRAAGGAPATVREPPAPGTIWLSRAGAEALGAQLGDPVVLGERTLTLAALVIGEPDVALDFFNVAPRAFFHADDVESTNLIQFGSRIAYRLYVAGEGGAVERWLATAKDALQRGQRIETAADARPELRSALDRADRFLGLAALVAVVLAGIAIAMAARRHADHHLDGCAVMRCLGASQRTVLLIQVGELFWIGVFGAAGGVLLAWLLQLAIGHYLADAMGLSIPAAGPLPALHGIAVGLLVLVAFALPPLLGLRRVPAVRVLRRDLGRLEPSAVLSAALGLGGLAALLWWQAGSATLGTVVLLGIVATLAALAVLALALVWLVRRVRHRLRGPWRYGLANVSRRARSSVVQVTALGLGLMAILLLTLVRTDLLERWQEALPDDAPNRFLVNVQPDQLDPVRQLLEDAGVPDPTLYPLVRARLVEHNGDAVSSEHYAARGERAQRLADREFNLSWAGTLREGDNSVVAGRFWAPDHSGETELSVEQKFAGTLGWALGDRVAFDIAGTRVEGRITSLRKVEWESFKPNFFVLLSPGALVDFPTSHIGAIHVPPQAAAVTGELVRRFPNISVIDIEAILTQVRRTADQVAQAVEYVFYFTLAAGVLVLLAAVTATQDERLLEGSVMRVVGASRRQLRLAQVSEFATIGLLAGLTAALAATLVSGLIATEAFDLPWRPDWRLAALGGALGVIAVTLAGLMATRTVVSAPPATTLRTLQG